MGMFDFLGGGDSGGGSFWGSLFGGGGGGESAVGQAGGMGTSDITRSMGAETTAFPSAVDAGGGGGGAGGGFWGSLYGGMSGLGDIAKTALPLAQVGTAGMGIASGIMGQKRAGEQMNILERQQKQQQAMAAPAAAAGGALTQAGAAALQGGALPPQLEEKATQYEDQIRMQYRQYLSSIGQTESTAMVQMEGVIKQMAAQYRQQLAESLYGQGLGGIQTAMGPSGAVSQTAMGIAGGTAGSMEAANASLAKLLAS